MTPTRHAEEPVEPAHPLGVASGQVVVHGDDVDALAFEGVEVRGQRGDERLAFTGLHLGDPAAVQDDAADQLHVEVPHVEHAAARPRARRRRLRAAGRRASAPLASRWRNSAVFSRSCASVSACMAGSFALISATIGRNFFSSRSFCVPMTLARIVLTSIEEEIRRQGIQRLYPNRVRGGCGSRGWRLMAAGRRAADFAERTDQRACAPATASVSLTF